MRRSLEGIKESAKARVVSQRKEDRTNRKIGKLF